MVKYKITINKDTCSACSSCYNLCPDLFEPDDESKSQLVEKYRTQQSESESVGIIEDGELYECALEAKDVCPTESISIEQVE